MYAINLILLAWTFEKTNIQLSLLKIHQQIRKSSRSKTKESIVVERENGITTNEEESMKIVTDWFEKAFKAENQTEFPEVPPQEMKRPFTGDEVSKAIKSLKNNKSAGKYDIVAEQLKYGP